MKALLIPAFGPVEQVEQDGLGDLRRLIEGHVEALPVQGRTDAAAYVDEEGMLKGLPANARATQLLDVAIAGSALLCGFDAVTGEDKPIPEDLAQALLAVSASDRATDLQAHPVKPPCDSIEAVHDTSANLSDG